MNASNGRWKEYDCNATLPAFCEGDVATTVSVTEVTSSAKSNGENNGQEEMKHEKVLMPSLLGLSLLFNAIAVIVIICLQTRNAQKIWDDGHAYAEIATYNQTTEAVGLARQAEIPGPHPHPPVTAPLSLRLPRQTGMTAQEVVLRPQEIGNPTGLEQTAHPILHQAASGNIPDYLVLVDDNGNPTFPREQMIFDSTAMEQRREEIAKLLSDADSGATATDYYLMPVDGSHIPRTDYDNIGMRHTYEGTPLVRPKPKHNYQKLAIENKKCANKETSEDGAENTGDDAYVDMTENLPKGRTFSKSGQLDGPKYAEKHQREYKIRATNNQSTKQESVRNRSGEAYIDMTQNHRKKETEAVIKKMGKSYLGAPTPSSSLKQLPGEKPGVGESSGGEYDDVLNPYSIEIAEKPFQKDAMEIDEDQDGAKYVSVDMRGNTRNSSEEGYGDVVQQCAKDERG